MISALPGVSQVIRNDGALFDISVEIKNDHPENEILSTIREIKTVQFATTLSRRELWNKRAARKGSAVGVPEEDGIMFVQDDVFGLFNNTSI